MTEVTSRKVGGGEKTNAYEGNQITKKDGNQILNGRSGKTERKIGEEGLDV